MKRPYHFFINPFLVAGLHNFALTVHMSTVYFNALTAAAPTNAHALARLGVYTTIHNTLLSEYAAWKAQGGSQEGETLNVLQLLVLLTGKVNTWDNMIRIVHGKTTARYKALFPDGHYSFSHGGKESIITAIKALSTNIGSEVALAPVKVLVDAAYTQLNDANNVQTGSKSTTKTLSDNVLIAVEDSCVKQYADFCLFISDTPKTPDHAGNFFDMSAIRDGAQVFYTHLVKGGMIHTVAKHKLEVIDQLWLENSGLTTLKIYVAATKGGPEVGGAFVLLVPGEIRTITATDLGNIALNYFICVQNMDANITGDFNLEFL
ncbi:MAG: hypothetical protein WCL14_09010 [Bacteroidota bacterium]